MLLKCFDLVSKVIFKTEQQQARERKKMRWTDLGLAKKEKQLDERKLCSFFAKPQKQICPPYFSSNTNDLKRWV